MNKPSAYGIITKGLGLPANRGMIVNAFNLGPLTVQIIIPPTSGGGGGSHPYAPGEFSDSILQPDYGHPKKLQRFDHINIVVTMNGNKNKFSITLPRMTITPLLRIQELLATPLRYNPKLSELTITIYKPIVNRVKTTILSVKAFITNK